MENRKTVLVGTTGYILKVVVQKESFLVAKKEQIFMLFLSTKDCDHNIFIKRGNISNHPH